MSLKYRFGFDDSLDVVGVHLVGGVDAAAAGGRAGQAEDLGSADAKKARPVICRGE